MEPNIIINNNNIINGTLTYFADVMRKVKLHSLKPIKPLNKYIIRQYISEDMHEIKFLIKLIFQFKYDFSLLGI